MGTSEKTKTGRKSSIETVHVGNEPYRSHCVSHGTCHCDYFGILVHTPIRKSDPSVFYVACFVNVFSCTFMDFEYIQYGKCTIRNGYQKFFHICGQIKT